MIDSNTAVIVIDMQNDFCSSEGALARLGFDVSKNQDVARSIPRFLHAARERGALIVWVLQAAREEFVSEAKRQQSAAMNRGATEVAAAGTWGAELYEGLEPAPQDVTIEKTKYSAFVGTPLRNLLHARERSKIVVCGTAGNVCVDSTARDGYMADYAVTVPRDLVGGTRPDLVDWALENLSFYFATVLESAELLANEDRKDPEAGMEQ